MQDSAPHDQKAPRTCAPEPQRRRTSSSCGSTQPRRSVLQSTTYRRRTKSDAVVAYLSDFVVVDGTADILHQERAIAADPRAADGVSARYVDSGRPGNPTRMGDALRRLIRDARAGRFAVLVVESILRLGPDLTTALQAALALVEAGVEIHEVFAGSIDITPDLAAHIDRFDPCGI